MPCPRSAGVSEIKFFFCFPDLGPNPGPGCLPLGSGRGDVELASVFASVASLPVSFVSGSICWNPLRIKQF